MKAKPDCLVCLLKQALNTVRRVSDDPAVHLRVIAEVAEQIPGLAMNQTPARLSKPAYEVVTRITGVKDPYAKEKKDTNRLALALLPEIRTAIAVAADPLSVALHAAVAGNIIDFGIGQQFEMKRDIMGALDSEFAVDATEDFRKELRPGRKLLYLGDNSGEIVFDMLLVEQLLKANMDVTFVVRSGPIINDATLADAEDVGLTKLVRVIGTGSDDIGINWDAVSGEFRCAFEAADVVLGKGHANFETCNDRSGNIYFLLKAKCEMVARELGARVGDVVFKHNRS